MLLLFRANTILVIGLSVILAAAQFVARQTDRLACLSIFDDGSGYSWIVDADRALGLPYPATETPATYVLDSFAKQQKTFIYKYLYWQTHLVSLYVRSPFSPRLILLDKIALIGEMSTSLSPDGKKLVYSWTNTKNQSFLASIQLDGTHRQISATPEHVDFLAWSPDGKYFDTYSEEDQNRQAQFNIHSADDLHVLFSAPAIEVDNEEQWSPDGQHVAFLWQDDARAFHVRFVTPDSSNNPPTMDVTLPNPQSISTGRQFLWSPDSQHLFVGLGDSVALIDANSGHLYDMTGVRGYVFWSSDGKTLATVSFGNGYSAWAAYSLTDGKLRQIQTIRAFVIDPVDPNRVVITSSEPNGNIGVDVMNLDGSNFVQIAEVSYENIVDNKLAQWSPDGKAIAIPWISTSGQFYGLTVARADGSRHYDLRPETDWYWSLSDGSTLVYTMRHQDGSMALNVLDMATGQQRTLIDGVAITRLLDQESDTLDLIGVWWQDNPYSAVNNVTIFKRDGTKVYQFTGSPLYPVPSNSMGIEDASALPAPDGRVALEYKYFNLPNRPGDRAVITIVMPDGRVVRFGLPVQTYGTQVDTNWIRCGEGL